VLSGRTWEIVSVDRATGTVVVRRGGARGRAPSWHGPIVEVDRPTWEAVREVLSGTEVPVEMDHRAEGWLQDARTEWTSKFRSPVRTVENQTVIDSFAGVEAHRAGLAILGLDGSVEGTTCTVEAPLDVVRRRANHLLHDFERALGEHAVRVASMLAMPNPELTAPSVLVAEARTFHVDPVGIQRVLLMAAEASWPS
jgi:hypothetical protein